VSSLQVSDSGDPNVSLILKFSTWRLFLIHRHVQAIGGASSPWLLDWHLSRQASGLISPCGTAAIYGSDERTEGYALRNDPL